MIRYIYFNFDKTVTTNDTLLVLRDMYKADMVLSYNDFLSEREYRVYSLHKNRHGYMKDAVNALHEFGFQAEVYPFVENSVCINKDEYQKFIFMCGLTQ